MRQIRRGVFETNSSSVHSITMCMKSDYDAWKNGELYWDRWGDKFATKEFVDKQLEEYREEFRKCYPDYIQGDEEWEERFERYIYDDRRFYTYDNFRNDIDCYYETFVDSFETPSGEEVVSFGYYGNDY